MGVALARDRRPLAQPRQDVDGGVERPGRGPAADATEPLDRDRRVAPELIHRPQGAEVVGDRVEPTRVDEPRSARLGLAVVAQPHQVDELGLACDVDVVGPSRRAGRDNRLAVVDVRADGGDHDPRGLGHRPNRRAVADVGDHQRQLTELRPQGRQPEAQLLELRLAAPGQRPPRPVAGVLRQVLGREPADETGRPEQDDVVRPLGGDYVILS